MEGSREFAAGEKARLAQEAEEKTAEAEETPKVDDTDIEELVEGDIKLKEDEVSTKVEPIKKKKTKGGTT
jgi:hypothetical protein